MISNKNWTNNSIEKANILSINLIMFGYIGGIYHTNKMIEINSTFWYVLITLDSYKLLPHNYVIIIHARSYMFWYKALLVNTFCIPILPLFAINFINIQTILHVLISQSRHHLYLEETTNAKHGFVWSSLNIYNSMLTFYNINLCIKINAAYGFVHTSECDK